MGLITNTYRVDEAITPKLHRLEAVLTRALRLVQPLNNFVTPSQELIAYCQPSRKGKRLVMCLYSELVSSLSSQELPSGTTTASSGQIGDAQHTPPRPDRSLQSISSV
jgi:hypothetical protein